GNVAALVEGGVDLGEVTAVAGALEAGGEDEVANGVGLFVVDALREAFAELRAAGGDAHRHRVASHGAHGEQSRGAAHEELGCCAGSATWRARERCSVRSDPPSGARWPGGGSGCLWRLRALWGLRALRPRPRR